MADFIIEHRKQQVPDRLKSNFKHLYFDIAWFGILSGSALSFIAVYMARIGASATQIGLFDAGPAMITLMFALPSGSWLKNKSLERSTFWSAAIFRSFYLLWIFLPIWLGSQVQIWVYVGLALLMSIPGTVLAISFNAMFADAVPPEWRGHVAGIRNAVLAIAFILSSLVCGALLTWLPFPLGYQVVFAIGFLGAAMSTLHLRFIHITPENITQRRTGDSLGDLARPGVIRSLSSAVRTSVGLRFLTRRQRPQLLRADILKGHFGKIALVLGLFHLSLFLPRALFPLFWVDRLHLTDANISMGNAVFYISVFVISTQLSRLTDRLGHYRIMLLGSIFLVAYPLITAFMQGLPLFLFNSVVGGVGWSLAGGAVNNYLLENIPEDERAVHLAWYNLIMNAAVLVSSLAGPMLSQQLGLVSALVVCGGARMFSALAIWRWGKSVVPLKSA